MVSGRTLTEGITHLQREGKRGDQKKYNGRRGWRTKGRELYPPWYWRLTEDKHTAVEQRENFAEEAIWRQIRQK